MSDTPQVVAELLERSHRLGSDPRNTNYAGGNTSAKGPTTDPVTGSAVEVMWVKGSGGDLGTLTERGLSVLRLDRLRALQEVFPGPEREDEMVAAFDFCLHGKGGAVPSIDTAMHGLVELDHVDHLHPDAGIALATAADGESLTKACFGDSVAWVPWRRPGFQLGLDIAAVQRSHPESIGVILGGHGITAWGRTSQESESNSLSIIHRAQAFIDSNGRALALGEVRPGFEALAEPERHRKAADLFPFLRRLASTDARQVGHYDDSPEVLDFLSRERLEELAARGTSCPDHFLRTKIRPLVLDLAAPVPLEQAQARLGELHESYRYEYQSYYRRYASADSPPMRGADPAIVLIPGVGMFSFGKDKQTARVASEFYRNAMRVIRGAEAISQYAPIPESEKFRIEYWQLEEDKLKRLRPPKPLSTRIALVTGGASGIGAATARRLAAEGACVVVADRDASGAAGLAAEIGNSDVAVGVEADVTDEDEIAEAVRRAVLAFGGVDLVVNNAGLSISKSLLDTTVADWDLQHDVMARGSFLVSRETARVMIVQAMGGDIIYVVSKNSVFAGPDNIAYGSTKADQAHQVRLLAAELGAHGIRVNGINPDAVVRGSGIFASGWGAKRAALYGVEESRLGEFYASRTLLKREVLPENVAAAVFVLAGGELSHTTGLSVPVDAGVAAAFLRWTAVRVAAIDLGASSGRVFVGDFGDGDFTLCEVARFRNGGIKAAGRLYWDVLGLYRGLLDGIHAAASGGELHSVGIDSWAVDYGLIDSSGQLLGNPVSHRDQRTRGAVEALAGIIEADQLYRRTGIALLPINTIFQLFASRDEPQLDAAQTLLLVPDLLGYWLTGSVGAEQTNASTTQLLKVDGTDWDKELATLVGIRPTLLPPIRKPGEHLGEVLPEVATEAGVTAPLPVIAVGSHDTASAVAGTPAIEPRFAYISCGTWSLVGIELEVPVLSRASRRANFTNERGIDGTIRFLRNVMGLWLLQESVRTWELAGMAAETADLVARAARAAPLRTLFDTDDPSFLYPGDMPQRIAAQCRRRGEPVAESPPEVVRAILDSLALAYRRTIRKACELSARQVEVVHIVGGGANNALLCQLTADACGLAVVAGPVEAAAIGNAYIQARSLGALSGDRWEVRSMISDKVELHRYFPSAGHDGAWEAAERRAAG